MGWRLTERQGCRLGGILPPLLLIAVLLSHGELNASLQQADPFLASYVTFPHPARATAHPRSALVSLITMHPRGGYMTDSLGTYLHDHLAGAAYAIDLVDFLRDQHRGDDLGHFASQILAEIKQDRDTLRRIAERIGGRSGTFKEAMAWMGEKVGRFKLGQNADSGLATFEALEFLAIGILGKRSLWRALAAVAPLDPRLAGIDFEALAASAQRQSERVETLRLRAARAAFCCPSPIGSHNPASSSQTNAWAIRRGTVVRSMAITAGVFLVVVLLPDVIRHLKIRAM